MAPQEQASHHTFEGTIVYPSFIEVRLLLLLTGCSAVLLSLAVQQLRVLAKKLDLAIACMQVLDSFLTCCRIIA